MCGVLFFYTHEDVDCRKLLHGMPVCALKHFLPCNIFYLVIFLPCKILILQNISPTKYRSCKIYKNLLAIMIIICYYISNSYYYYFTSNKEVPYEC